MRDSFVFYRSFYEAMEGLSDAEKGQCFEVLANYAINGEEPRNMTPVVRLFFIMARPQIDKNNQRFENGKNGGRGKNQTETKNKPNENQTETKPEANVNVNVNVIKKDNLKVIQKNQKINFENVVDWESLFEYWEQNKKGGKYKNAESRNRMFDKLKDLTNGDFELAKQAITYAIDNNYQGFTDGSRLFYRNVSAAPASRKTADDDFYAKLNALGTSND